MSDVEQRGEEEGLVGGWGFDAGGGETRHLLLLLHLHLHNTTPSRNNTKILDNLFLNCRANKTTINGYFSREALLASS